VCLCVFLGVCVGMRGASVRMRSVCGWTSKCKQASQQAIPQQCSSGNTHSRACPVHATRAPTHMRAHAQVDSKQGANRPPISDDQRKKGARLKRGEDDVLRQQRAGALCA